MNKTRRHVLLGTVELVKPTKHGWFVRVDGRTFWVSSFWLR
jgi:hypothetical protein